MNDLVQETVNKPVISKIEKMIVENPSLSKNEICIIFSPENIEVECNEQIVWTSFEYKSDKRNQAKYSFTFPERGEFHIFIKAENGMIPFPRDERNLFPASERKWISNLSVLFKEEELIVPISIFTSLSVPTKIDVILDKNNEYENFSIRFYSDGFDVTQFNFNAFSCGEKISYDLESTVSWLPRMFGDSYQKTIFKTPLCN